MLIFSIALKGGVILGKLILHMGHIALEEYYAQICPLFSKFEQSVLGNDLLWRLKYFTPVLVSQSTTSRHNIWDPI